MGDSKARIEDRQAKPGAIAGRHAPLVKLIIPDPIEYLGGALKSRGPRVTSFLAALLPSAFWRSAASSGPITHLKSRGPSAFLEIEMRIIQRGPNGRCTSQKHPL